MFLVLLVPAVAVASPAVSDLCSIFAALLRSATTRKQFAASFPRLLFLVPAHNEELLIDRCVRSLLEQAYPRERLQIVVVADNCTDGTAAAARAAGARVLVRESQADFGKAYAIDWALRVLQAEVYEALVIVDGDSVVDRSFARSIAAFPSLDKEALQCYDGPSNEFETWLTTLAGLYGRYRYDLALPLKQRAGLSIPLTGCGTVLGRAIVREYSWNPNTITEGWELYARLTVAGVRVQLAREARVYAQETRRLSQSWTQRARWSAGRFAVFRQYFKQILRARRLSLHQRLDLLAELASQGPVVQVSAGLMGAAATFLLPTAGRTALLVMYLAPIVQHGLYSTLSLLRHPQRTKVLLALARLPLYAAWRLGLAVALIIYKNLRTSWIQTARHTE